LDQQGGGTTVKTRQNGRESVFDRRQGLPRRAFLMSGPLELTLAAGPEAAAVARRALGDLEDELGTDLLRDVRLMVSELVTNALRHAGRPQNGIVMRRSLRDELLRIEVGDRGPGFTPVAPRDPSGEGGWGLLLVDALADRWGVARMGSMCSVWFEVDVAERAVPGARTDGHRRVSRPSRPFQSRRHAAFAS
jgi:anti-sigma regulatory factor (Ser/Thr protein kinase)